MHELAHIILAHKPERLEYLTARFVYRDYPKRQEREAEFLGSCLQIPAVGVDYVRQLGFEKQAISEYYGASNKMVQWRLNMT